MTEILFDGIRKGAIVVVDIQQVVGEEIVIYIDIGPAVVVEIGDIYGEAIAVVMNAGLCRYIGKYGMMQGVVPVVAEKFIGIGIPELVRGP